jgi:hypothetical protein
MAKTVITPAILQQAERLEGVRSAFETVTPDMATKWLEGNTHNRSVRDSVVTRYATDMKAGRWKQTHQGIAFDAEGTLIDGQHRLFAILEAGVPVVLQVTRGLPMDTQMVVDDNISRSVTDVLKIGDRMPDITAFHTAVSERMRLSIKPRSSQRAMTRQERADFLITHWEAVRFAVSCFPIKKRLRGVVTAAAVAAVGRAFYHEDRAGLQRFAHVLVEGISRNEAEENIIVLRNWLLTREGNAGDAQAIEVYAKTLRALVAFFKGERIKRGHLYAVTEDPYTLPRLKVSK